MVDSDGSGSDFEEECNVSFKIPRFNGTRNDDYGLWRMRLRTACRAKSVWNVVENSCGDAALSSSSASPATTSRTTKKCEKASGIIISALGDAALSVIIEADDDPSKMLKLLDARYASNRTVSRIAVQTQLFRMSYSGQNIADYVYQYMSLFSQLERMGNDAAIPGTYKAPMLLASINPNCFLESTAAALRTKETTELTWEYVATTLIDEYNARHVSEKPNGGDIGQKHRNKRNKALKAFKKSISPAPDTEGLDDESDIDRTIHAFAVALRSSKSRNNATKSKCDFCDRPGHSMNNCFVNPDNPNNRLPSKILEAVNATSGRRGGSAKLEQKDNTVEFAGSATESTSVSPPNDSRTYADSGAKIHIFHARNAFVPGPLLSCDQKTVCLSDNAKVTTDTCGEVIIPMNDCVIRLREVMFIPSLGYNLVSTGRLADNGIESHFRRSEILLKLESNGTLIGRGSRDVYNGMYVLPSPQTQSALASISLSDRDIKLWHRRLAHINIKDLLNVHKFADDVPELTPIDDVCRACQLGKAHKLPFTGHFRRASAVGQIMHSDIVGT